MIAPRSWTLPQLEQYAEISIETMARQGVVSSDADGNALVERGNSLREEDGRLRVQLAPNLSASGLSAAVPLTISTQGAGAVTWSIGGVLIATLPGDWMPEEAGEALGKHKLRAAFRAAAQPRLAVATGADSFRCKIMDFC